MSINKLEDLLYDDDVNKSNLTLLLGQFKRENFVAFIGAGLPCGMKDVPSWAGLHKRLKTEYSIKQVKERKLPDSFSYLYEKCSPKEEFYKQVFKFVKPSTSPPSVYYIIHDNFDCYATTNFYDPIEDADSVKEWGIRKRYFAFPESLENQKDSLTYLHGHPDIGFCILRREDYDYFYPSLSKRHIGVPVLENSLRYLFTQKQIIFLGCSIEDHLKEFLRYLINYAKGDDINKAVVSRENVQEHFWIIDQSVIEIDEKLGVDKKKVIVKKFFENYSALKIRPILYNKNEHLFVDHLCEALGLKRKPIEVVEQPDIKEPVS